MSDLLTPFVVFTLILVIIIQALERYFFAEQVEKEKARLLAAVLSKNIGEYTTAIKVDKEPAQADVSNDEIDLANATDDEFFKHIKQQTK